jgi:DNA-binding NtrC family response regulator
MTKSKPLRSLIVDADREHSESLEALLSARKMSPVICTSLSEARELLEEKSETLAVAIIALDLPDGEGLELLGESSLFSTATEIALMHDKDDPVRARLGINQQATYFFCKPLDPEFLGELLDDIKQDWSAEPLDDSDQLNCAVDQFGLLRGSSPPMRKLYRTIRKIAATDSTVLLVGESGTGKELAARTLHEMSGLSGPFVAMNCGAIAADLAESELFGHEKGSFSGAEKKHIGYFERAEGGTLLLDEIGEMPHDLQVKLLRVLESRKFRRVGGTHDIEINVRILSATNRDTQAAINEGLLREDLYYRIAQFPLKMPALRDRGQDIIGLSQYFLNELNELNGTGKYFSENVLSAIMQYPWPGNVRELKSAIERAYIMAEQQLQTEHFPAEQIDSDVSDDYLRVPVGSSIEQTEKKLIFATLDAMDGNKKDTADSLGISLKTLYNRLKEYDRL